MKVRMRRNQKIRLKIDTPPYIHVCIMLFFRIQTCSLNIMQYNKDYLNFILILFIDDHSRVVLDTFTAGEGDYINANYIEVCI